ncbi:MAG: GT4 family glycosyltransferase PelF [Nitrospirales bacterium]|nr:GT4 family glycosyltransferase PelF [Nitrospira sp.]MDR4502704.1 GT4 family glycosyltransferase PelF [Nitrospirales bacterium]
MIDKKMTSPQADEVDIALLLEGTYPYVSGGVSSWVHQIIQAFPEFRFGLVFIGGHPGEYGDMRYVLPEHVVHLEAHYVHANHDQPPIKPVEGDTHVFRFIDELHTAMRAPESCPHAVDLTQQMLALLTTCPEALQEQFLYSEPAWDFLCQTYRRHCTDPSFVDFFWTVRKMHEPIWMLGKVAASLIPAKVYHTVSTGYAGFLGALLHHRTGRPLILSEHGIYTKERRIDLFQMTSFRDNRSLIEKRADHLGYFQQLWIRFFEILGTLCYDAANPIISLYEVNRQRQIHDGADERRTLTIPNGIPVERFEPLRASRPSHPPPILCLIGRVVPIKDVKTFIRAMRTVVNRMPEAQGWIAGPEDEDKDYVQDCKHLTESLGLTQHVRFMGFQNVHELLPQIGLLILSSISEALPLVVLEGFAAGVPAVTTDVGACRQLIEGEGILKDQAGRAGAVVSMANPTALAEAALSLLTDTDAWRAAQKAGITRVESFYTQRQMIDHYRSIYAKALETWQALALSSARS